MIRFYEEKSTDVVMEFFEELIKSVPFAVIQIQTDNDSAFTDKYTSREGKPTGTHPVDRWCNKRDIEHKLIPIGEKELNGKVENSHKRDDREFYSQFQGRTFDEIKRATKAYEFRWNNSRRVRSLDRKKPQEVVEWSYVRTLFYLQTIQELCQPNKKPFLRLLDSGDLVHQIKMTKPKKNKNKTKKLSIVNRYLQYIKWREQY